MFLTWWYFVKPSGSDNTCDVARVLNLHRKLTWELIDNPFLTATQCEESNMAVDSQECALRTALPHASAYRNRCWVLGIRGKYQRYKCRIASDLGAEHIAHALQGTENARYVT